MATYVVHRCHYNNPSEKSLRKFEGDDTVLDWFRSRWVVLRDASEENSAYDQLLEEFGFNIYGLASLFEAANENNIAAPESDEQLAGYLDEYLYVEGEVKYKPHLLQAITDDDEFEQAYYFFDDIYLKKNSGKVAFLMHDDWKLPTEFGKGKFQPDSRVEVGHLFSNHGTVYFAYSECVDSANLDPIVPTAFSGVRLPDFPQMLFSVTPTDDWPKELVMLRSMMFCSTENLPAAEKVFVEEIHKNPVDPGPWMVYSDWLAEHQAPPMHIGFLNRAMDGLKQVSPSEIYNFKEDIKSDWLDLESAAKKVCEQISNKGLK